jgi:hypothetical protein
MKILRFVLVLAGASLFASTVAFAADQVAAKDPPKDQPACSCPKDKDGKVCGVDKACCCSGAKACKDDKKKDDCKKDDSKKDGCKKDDCKKVDGK